MSLDPRDKRSRVVQLGRYEVRAHIASGGMGAVYRAWDPKTRRDVAIKVLPKETASQPGRMERFRGEYRNAARLKHDHIVTLMEFDEYQGTYYLVMEYVDGVDLEQYVKGKGKVDPKEARFIIGQAAKALYHAHKRGIIHRDIKPSNFLIARKNNRPHVKLTDFGLAIGPDEEEFKLTREGTTVGTVDYMAPEQARNSRSADVRSDIYSLGCTLYHLLAGSPPFAEGTLTERLYKHSEVAPTPIRQLNPAVPVWFAAVLDKMLAKNPADRYQTAKDLLQALVEGKVDTAERGEVLRSLAELEAQETRKTSVRRDKATTRKNARPDSANPADDLELELDPEGGMSILLIAAAGLAILALLFVVILLVVRGL